MSTYIASSKYGVFGDDSLLNEMPRIIEVLNVQEETLELDFALIAYSFERAALESIKIDHISFEKRLNKYSKIMKPYEEEELREACLSIAFYFYTNGINPKKAIKYLNEACKDPKWYHSAIALKCLFYNNGFGYKKDHVRAVNLRDRVMSKTDMKKGILVGCKLDLSNLEL